MAIRESILCSFLTKDAKLLGGEDGLPLLFALLHRPGRRHAKYYGMRWGGKR